MASRKRDFELFILPTGLVAAAETRCAPTKCAGIANGDGASSASRPCPARFCLVKTDGRGGAVCGYRLVGLPVGGLSVCLSGLAGWRWGWDC